MKKSPISILSVVAGLLWLVSPCQAEFLFTSNGDFIVPTLSASSKVRYSEWRGFYATSTVGNLPTYYAESGGTSPDGGVTWFPTPRPTDDPAFPAYPDFYTVPQPNAFWDVRNPTITQTNPATGHITAGGNSYGLAGPQSFVLNDNTSLTSDQTGAASLGYTANTVVFQFQTDGQVTDLSTIRLVYQQDGVEKSISAADLSRVEYLTEYRPPADSSTDPSASQGYQNRTVLQWDLTGLGITSYSIEWDTEAHTSFQQTGLSTSDTYVPGIPVSHAWTGGSGSWEDGANWLQRAGNVGFGTVPEENGNVRFENSTAATIDVTGTHTVGELIFDSANDVTIDTSTSGMLTANTGISTTDSATGTYVIKPDYVLGALNMFDINAGKVVMDGVISGNYSLVKQGAGSLVLAGSNTFNGSLDIQGGEVELDSANFYTGNTTLRGGSLLIEANGALGTSSSAINVGYDATFFDNATPAEMILDGALNLNRDIVTVANGSQVILAARNTGAAQAVYSGNVTLTGGTVDVIFRAENSSDKLAFTGAITGGARSTNLTLDGPGTVIFSGSDKLYNDSTVVSNGTLILQSAYKGAGNITVKNGATFRVDGSISTATTTTVTLENGARLEGGGTIGRKVITGGIESTIVADGGLSLTSLDATQGITLTYEQPINEGTLLSISGQITGGSTDSMRFSFEDITGLEAGVTYTLFSFGNAVGLDALDLSILNPGLVLDESFGSGGWLIGDHSVEVQFSAVPEPSTYALLAAGILLLTYASRRKKNFSLTTTN